MMLDTAPTCEAPLDGRGSDASAVTTPKKKPVVIVLHMSGASPGHVGRWFRENGYPLDIRRPFEGDALPATLEQHTGAVIFGGSQSANDNLDYIRQEIDWIGVALKEQKPYLGICLGAQMLARHLGAKVEHCEHGRVEIGYHRIQQVDQGRVLGQLPEHVYQWHREGLELPHGADLLATAEGTFENQAFVYGPAALGVQFHPEIMHTQINSWSGSNPVRLLLRGAHARQEQLAAHLMHAPRVHAWLDQMLRRWVEGRLGT
jgi:GMP synthase (glutamine-hydrolysing)